MYTLGLAVEQGAVRVHIGSSCGAGGSACTHWV